MTIEPVASAVHAVLAAGLRDGDTVAVLGAGTVGLAVVAALTHLAATGQSPDARGRPRRCPLRPPARARRDARRHRRPPGRPQLGRAVRRRSRSLVLGPPAVRDERLTGGADVVFDCVGSSNSIAQALDLVRPRGRVALVGMPGHVHVDLTSLWHREVTLAGTYAYGVEAVPNGDTAAPVRTFDLAIETVAAKRTGQLVSARYPLDRFEEAVTTPARPVAAVPSRSPSNCRPPAHDQEREPMSPRPGFVLEVDRSTPPTLFWHGERFALRSCRRAAG